MTSFDPRCYDTLESIWLSDAVFSDLFFLNFRSFSCTNDIASFNLCAQACAH